MTSSSLLRRGRFVCALAFVAATAASAAFAWPQDPGGAPGAPVRGAPTPVVPAERLAEPAFAWSEWWAHRGAEVLARRAAAQSWNAASYSLDGIVGEAGSPFSFGPPAEAARAEIEGALLHGARDPRDEVAAASLAALGRAARPGGHAYGVLVAALYAPDNRDRGLVREGAALGLGRLGDGAATLHLLKVFRDAPDARLGGAEVSPRLRGVAALALGLLGARRPDAVGADVVEALVAAVGAPAARPDVGAAAAAALGDLRAESAVPSLLAALSNEALDDAVRAHAAAALGRIGVRSTVPYLAGRGLTDRKSAVVRASATALGRLAAPDDAATVARLVAVARDHADRGVRDAALLALGELASPHAREFLLAAARDGRGDDRTFGALAAGLHGLGAPADRGVLGDALLKRFRAARSDEELSAFALALGLVDGAEAAPALKEALLESARPRVRGYAALGLALLSGPKDARTLEAVRAAVASVADDDARRAAAAALGLCRDPAAARVLTEALRAGSADPAFLDDAARALGAVGDLRVVPALGAALRAPARGRDAERAFVASALGRLGDDATDRPVAALRTRLEVAPAPEALVVAGRLD